MKDEVLALIRELAAMLEPGAQAVWEIMLRQQTVVGVSDVCVGVMLFLVGVVSLAMASTVARRDPDASGFVVIIGLLTLPFSLAFLVPGIQRLSNPAYYAIMALKGML